jgi:hypothetical protein
VTNVRKYEARVVFNGITFTLNYVKTGQLLWIESYRDSGPFSWLKITDVSGTTSVPQYSDLRRDIEMVPETQVIFN